MKITVIWISPAGSFWTLPQLWLLPFLGGVCRRAYPPECFPDFLMKRGLSASIARKSSHHCRVVAFHLHCRRELYVERKTLMVMFLTIAFVLAMAFSSIAWVMVSSTSRPNRLLGLTGGAVNFFGNMSSDHPGARDHCRLPRCMGTTSSLRWFISSAALPSWGRCLIYFLVGRVERVEE